MAKQSNKRVVQIKASTLATFMGTFAAIWGLGVAILYSLNTTVEVAAQTNSVLSGLAFGLATGAISIIVLPLIYFGIGWVVGIVTGWVYNVVLGASGGIVFNLEDE
jgi:hypothetical protein